MAYAVSGIFYVEKIVLDKNFKKRWYCKCGYFRKRQGDIFSVNIMLKKSWRIKKTGYNGYIKLTLVSVDNENDYYVGDTSD